MLKIADTEVLNIQQFISNTKEKAKKLINESVDSYVFDPGLELVANKNPTNKNEICIFLLKVAQFYTQARAKLDLQKHSNDSKKKDLVLLTAFVGHIYYLFNFSHKNQKCEEMFTEFLKLYENAQFDLGSKEAEFYAFLTLSHNVHYLTHCLKREKSKHVIKELRNVLNFVDIYTNNTKDPNLIAQACILASTIRTSSEILNAYKRQDSVWDFHQAVLDCEKAEKALADGTNNPLAHVVRAQKFIASYYDWHLNQSLKELPSKSQNIIPNKNLNQSVQIDKNKISNQEAMYLLLEDDRTDRIIEKVEKDPKKMTLFARFICQLYIDCKINEGIDYHITNLLANKFDKAECAYVRGVTIEDIRLIFRLTPLQKMVLRYNCRVYEKAFRHYNHSTLIEKPLSNQSDEYFTLLSQWEQSLTKKKRLVLSDRPEDFNYITSVNKKLSELKLAREQGEKDFVIAQQRSDKIFAEFMAECLEKEAKLEEEFKQKQASIRQIVLEESKEEIIDIDDQKLQPSNTPKNISPEYEFYNSGEKAFHHAQMTTIHQEKIKTYQEAIRCLAAATSQATAKLTPNYEIVAKAQSFIADCNLGLANTAYQRNEFVSCIQYRLIAIEENLSKAISAVEAVEKTIPNEPFIKRLKASIIFQIETLKLDTLALEALIKEKLAIRNQGRDEAMKRLGDEWYKGKKFETISYFTRERLELVVADNKMGVIKNKLEKLYPQFVRKVPNSLVALLDKSKVSSIFRSVGNASPVGDIEAESEVLPTNKLAPT